MNIDETHCDDRIFLGRYCYAELLRVKHVVYTRKVHKKLLSNFNLISNFQFVVYELTLDFKRILFSISTA